MGEGRTLLRQVDAELAQLRIRDLAVSRRLRRVVADSAADLDVPDEGETFPVDTGAVLALGVIEEFAESGAAIGDFTPAEEELLRLDTLLRERHSSSRRIEHASGRSLLRQALRGRRGDGQ